MRSWLIILSLCMLLSSCKAIIENMYGMNRRMPFSTRAEYIHYLETKKNYPLSSILVPDSSSYSGFLFYTFEKDVGLLYGSFLNDTTQIRKSDYLKENINCMGRILKDLEDNLGKIDQIPDSLLVKYDFNQFRFKEASSGKDYRMDHSQKPLKLFLLYYYRSGRYFDPVFKEVMEFALAHEKEVDLKIIVTDRIALQ